ncbi:AP3D1 isoform 9, partial [Pan troglodytes]
ELSVLDSLNARMARPQGSSVHDGVPVPFQLPPGVSNEAQYVFTIQSIVMAQKLKGTLSFIAKNDEGATHEKLDFRLHFSCSSYLITTPCYSDAFAKLLESGDLSMSSIKVDGIRMSFQNLLAKICFHHHFSGLLKLWPRAAQEGGPCSGGGAAATQCPGSLTLPALLQLWSEWTPAPPCTAAPSRATMSASW